MSPKKTKERDPESQAARAKAREIAKGEGQAWATLSKEEKVGYLTKAGLPQGSGAADRKKARVAAKGAGLKWKELPKEQRQQYLEQARKK